MAALSNKLKAISVNKGTEVTTTDATATVLARFVVREPGAYFLDAKVVGVKSDHSEAATYWRQACVVLTDAGLISRIPALTTRTVVADNESDSDWNCTVSTAAEDVDGDGTSDKTINVNVVGKASTTINWRAVATLIQVI